MTPPAAPSPLHAALLVDSSHTWSFLGEADWLFQFMFCVWYLLHSSVFNHVTYLLVCVNVCNKLIFLHTTDISIGYKECNVNADDCGFYTCCCTSLAMVFFLIQNTTFKGLRFFFFFRCLYFLYFSIVYFCAKPIWFATFIKKWKKQTNKNTFSDKL